MAKDGSYHHGDLSGALLRAVDEAVRRDGPDAVSLRACARMVGVAPSAVFRHFRDKRALMTAYAVRGLTELGVSLRDAAAAAPKEGRVAAIAQAYLAFASDCPHRYRALFRGDCVDREDEAYRQATRTVAAACGLESLRIGQSSSDAGLMLWAALHGLSGLGIDGPDMPALPADAAERRQALSFAARHLCRALAPLAARS